MCDSAAAKKIKHVQFEAHLIRRVRRNDEDDNNVRFECPPVSLDQRELAVSIGATF